MGKAGGGRGVTEGRLSLIHLLPPGKAAEFWLWQRGPEGRKDARKRVVLLHYSVVTQGRWTGGLTPGGPLGSHRSRCREHRGLPSAPDKTSFCAHRQPSWGGPAESALVRVSSGCSLWPRWGAGLPTAALSPLFCQAGDCSRFFWSPFPPNFSPLVLPRWLPGPGAQWLSQCPG